MGLVFERLPPAVLGDHARRGSGDDRVARRDALRHDAAEADDDVVRDAASRCEPNGTSDVAPSADRDIALDHPDTVGPELRLASGDPRAVAENEAPGDVEEVMVRDARFASDRELAGVRYGATLARGPDSAIENVVALDVGAGADRHLHGSDESVESSDRAVIERSLFNCDHGAEPNPGINDPVAEAPSVEPRTEEVGRQPAYRYGERKPRA
ncbi:MAG: hypothetical protein IT293_12625 [Deltaproteobacteria bacterium]|nr:hypothetical protein [Deltaproteobacteria bacterium]